MTLQLVATIAVGFAAIFSFLAVRDLRSGFAAAYSNTLKRTLPMFASLPSPLRRLITKSATTNIGRRSSKPSMLTLGTTRDHKYLNVGLPAIIYASGESGTGLETGVMLNLAEQLIQRGSGLLFLDARDPQCGTYSELCLMAHAAGRHDEPQASQDRAGIDLLHSAAHGSIVWHNMNNLRHAMQARVDSSAALLRDLADAITTVNASTPHEFAVFVNGLDTLLAEQQAVFTRVLDAAVARGVSVIVQSDRCLQPELWYAATCFVLSRQSPSDSLCSVLARAAPFRPEAAQLLGTLAPSEALVCSVAGEAQGDYLVKLRIPDAARRIP